MLLADDFMFSYNKRGISLHTNTRSLKKKRKSEAKKNSFFPFQSDKLMPLPLLNTHSEYTHSYIYKNLCFLYGSS